MIIQLIKIKHVQLQTKTIYNCHIQKKQEALDSVLKTIFRVTVGVTTRLEKGGGVSCYNTESQTLEHSMYNVSGHGHAPCKLIKDLFRRL
jgi:hypothetical protein